MAWRHNRPTAHSRLMLSSWAWSKKSAGLLPSRRPRLSLFQMRLRTAVTALFGSAILLSHGVENLALPKVSGVKKVLLLIFCVASFLAVPAARVALIVLTFRHREYLADASAAGLTQNPRAPARALRKIEQAAGSSIMIKGNVAPPVHHRSIERGSQLERGMARRYPGDSSTYDEANSCSPIDGPQPPPLVVSSSDGCVNR